MSRQIRQKILDRLSREEGAVRKDPGGKITVALGFPNHYRLGMSNLGFQGVYRLLNERDDVVCERVFFPDPEDLREHRDKSVPLTSYESQRPLKDFHVVAFSVSYENDYPNLVAMLGFGGVSPWADVRTDHDPLVILGGVCPTYNPEPLAPFADVIFVGESETTLGPFFDALAAVPSREDLRIATLDQTGIYWPSMYEVVYDAQGRLQHRRPRAGAPAAIRKGMTKDLDTGSSRTTIFTRDTEFSDMCLTEVSRGCPWGCNFCVAGSIYLPVRHRGIAAVRREVEMLSESRGGKRRFGIIAPSPSDFPGVVDLLSLPGVSLSLSSLRARKKTADILPRLVEKGQKTISIAAEAGTERLRKVIRKRITEDEILETATMAGEAGIQMVRLYFMVGLPTETEEDIDGIVDLARKVRDRLPKGKLSLSASCFVPKPFTPFQWEAFGPESVLKARIERIKKGIRRFKGVSVSGEPPSVALKEAFFSRGDRRAAQVTHALATGTSWAAATKKSGLDLGDYVCRKRDYRELLPWDFIDLGIDKTILRKRSEKAHAEDAR